MHRHGYKGRKFGRERDQRNALKTGLILALIEHKSIKTTLPKAKDIRPAAEKLITLAKKGDLSSRRSVISRLGNIKLGNVLVDEIAPKIKRNSGYLRIVKLDENRVGDNAEMARIEFVDLESVKKTSEEIKEVKTEVKAKAEKPAKTPAKPAAKKEDK